MPDGTLRIPEGGGRRIVTRGRRRLRYDRVVERSTRQRLRFVLLSGALMAAFYVVLYYPYDGGALPVRALAGYLGLLARVCVAVIRMGDPSARVAGDAIDGHFSMRIVLDCGALDAQALFAAAVLGFPAPWSRKLVGVAGGLAVIALANLARIVALYFIGWRRPAAFHLWHEEVLQLAIVLVAAAAFAAWALWTRRGPREQARAV